MARESGRLAAFAAPRYIFIRALSEFVTCRASPAEGDVRDDIGETATVWKRLFKPGSAADDVPPPEVIRRLSMCPFLEAWSGGNAVVFARRTDVERVSYAWFVLAADNACVIDCGLRMNDPEARYRRFVERTAARVRLGRVSPEQAKTRVFQAVWRGERSGRLAPRLFAVHAGLMDGVQILDVDLGGPDAADPVDSRM